MCMAVFPVGFFINSSFARGDTEYEVNIREKVVECAKLLAARHRYKQSVGRDFSVYIDRKAFAQKFDLIHPA